MAKIVPDDRVRQGPRGRPVLLVLIASLFLIGLYLVSLLMWSGSESPTNPSQAAAERANQPNASSANTARTPPANPAYPVPADSSATTGSTGAGTPNRQ